MITVCLKNLLCIIIYIIIIIIKIEANNAIPIQNNKDLNSRSAPWASEHAKCYFLIDTKWSREQKNFL